MEKYINMFAPDPSGTALEGRIPEFASLLRDRDVRADFITDDILFAMRRFDNEYGDGNFASTAEDLMFHIIDNVLWKTHDYVLGAGDTTSLPDDVYFSAPFVAGKTTWDNLLARFFNALYAVISKHVNILAMGYMQSILYLYEDNGEAEMIDNLLGMTSRMRLESETTSNESGSNDTTYGKTQGVFDSFDAYDAPTTGIGGLETTRDGGSDKTTSKRNNSGGANRVSVRDYDGKPREWVDALRNIHSFSRAFQQDLVNTLFIFGEELEDYEKDDTGEFVRV